MTRDAFWDLHAAAEKLVESLTEAGEYTYDGEWRPVGDKFSGIKAALDLVDSFRSGSIEDRMRVLHDTKKVIDYSKSTGTWTWRDKDVLNVDDDGPRFATFLECLVDATQPYFEE